MPYTGSNQERQDRAAAAGASEASETASSTTINQGLGDLIKKTGKGISPTPTPMPSMGAPKREDFPPGLGGQGEFSRALSAWKAKNDKPISGGKSLGGSR